MAVLGLPPVGAGRGGVPAAAADHLHRPFSGAPFSFRSFSGALPLTAVRLLNLYLGLVAALLATEFVKRDRQLDSSEAVLANSFTNPGYVAAKMLGIGLAVGGLAAAVLAVVGVNHRFFTDAPFAWQPYLLLPLVGTLPTLVLTCGLACLLITLLRSQAVVLVLMLGLSAAAVFAGQGRFQLFDAFGFWIPMAWSDFVGFGNEAQLLQVRGAHLLAGLGMIAASALLMGRLRQSPAANLLAAVLAAACLGGSAWTGGRVPGGPPRRGRAPRGAWPPSAGPRPGSPRPRPRPARSTSSTGAGSWPSARPWTCSTPTTSPSTRCCSPSTRGSGSPRSRWTAPRPPSGGTGPCSRSPPRRR